MSNTKSKLKRAVKKVVPIGLDRKISALDEKVNIIYEKINKINESMSTHDFRIDELKEKIKHVEPYQPIYGVDGVIDTPARDSIDRCNIIIDTVGDVTGKRMLDIGSSLGYVSFFMTDRGAIVDGWENNSKNCEVARLVGNINGLDAKFYYKELNVETSSLIKQNYYDVIIVLNVFHHMIRFLGLEQTKLVVKNLLEKTPAMVVELAKKGEDETLPWDKFQPESELAIFNGLDVDIKKITEVSNHLSSAKRPIYLIESKKKVKVNNKNYTYYHSTNYAYKNSPLRRMGKSFHRKYYFGDDYIIKEYGINTDLEKRFNLPEAYQDIASLSLLNRLKEKKKISLNYPELVDAEISDGASRIVIKRIKGKLLSELGSEMYKESSIDKDTLVRFASKQLLGQLVELKRNNLFHNDIRSWNIIINDDSASLIDFGNMSHTKFEDDLHGLIWAIYGFLSDSREVYDIDSLPDEKVFGKFAFSHELYILIKNKKFEVEDIYKNLYSKKIK